MKELPLMRYKWPICVFILLCLAVILFVTLREPSRAHTTAGTASNQNVARVSDSVPPIQDSSSPELELPAPQTLMSPVPEAAPSQAGSGTNLSAGEERDSSRSNSRQDAFAKELLKHVSPLARPHPSGSAPLLSRMRSFVLLAPLEETLRILEEWVSSPRIVDGVSSRAAAVRVCVFLGEVVRLHSVPPFFHSMLDDQNEHTRRWVKEMIEATNDKQLARTLADRLEDLRYTADALWALRFLRNPTASDLEKLGRLIADDRYSAFYNAMLSFLSVHADPAYVEECFAKRRNLGPPDYWQGSVEEYHARLDEWLQRIRQRPPGPPEMSAQEKWEYVVSFAENKEAIWYEEIYNRRPFWVELAEKYGATPERVREHYEWNKATFDDRKRAGWLKVLQRVGGALSPEEYQFLAAWEEVGWLWVIYQGLKRLGRERELVTHIDKYYSGIPVAELLKKVGVILEE